MSCLSCSELFWGNKILVIWKMKRLTFATIVLYRKATEKNSSQNKGLCKVSVVAKNYRNQLYFHRGQEVTLLAMRKFSELLIWHLYITSEKLLLRIILWNIGVAKWKQLGEKKQTCSSDYFHLKFKGPIGTESHINITQVLLLREFPFQNKLKIKHVGTYLRVFLN